MGIIYNPLLCYAHTQMAGGQKLSEFVKEHFSRVGERNLQTNRWNMKSHYYKPDVMLLCCRVWWLRLWVVRVRPDHWFAWLPSRLVGVSVGELDDQLHRLSGVLDFPALT